MNLTLDSNIQYVPQVGPAKAALLSKLNINTVRDLIYYAPFRYQDYSITSKISDIQAGETITVKAKVLHNLNIISKSGKKIQKATISDDSGKIDLIWFNQPYLIKVLTSGTQAYFSGTASWFGRNIVLTSPDYEIIPQTGNQIHTGRLVPIYSTTENLSVKWLRGRISYLIENNFHELDEYIPEEISKKYNLMPISQSLKMIHFPQNMDDAKKAMRRLAFEELLNLQISLFQARYQREHNQKTQAFKIRENDTDNFCNSLPFKLTNDQMAAIKQINTDVRKSTPMNRILIGDVGSGKTIIAVYLMYLSALNGLSSVLMAPTQILATQHYQNIKDILSKFNLEVSLITSQSKPKISKTVANPLVYIGTHALLSSPIISDNTGCIIIDEQQRFGVNQRQLLSQKTKIPHLLSMTATPIPRTIALTIFGNTDITMIKEMPHGSKIIKTWLVPEQKRLQAYEWMKSQISKNQVQAFVVCPFIEESETSVSVKAVKKEYEYLKKDVFSGYNTGLLHGKLKSQEKDRILDNFKNHEIQILVSTPVVEVGIDIPNANIMVIEGAERFGLSQLHQLRGRVGRGTKEAFCLLFTGSEDNPKIIDRIKSLENHHNGLELAEIDLKLRGPGELLGVRQHGIPQFRYASFFDMDLINETRESANNLVNYDPELNNFPS